MWPFEAKRKRSLVGLTTTAAVDVTATITSADEVESPFSELRAALVWIELSESRSLGSRREIMDVVGSGADLSHFDGHRGLGSVVLGDTLLLRTDDSIDVTLSPRRADFVFARREHPWLPLTRKARATLPAELKTLLESVSEGDVRYREIALLQGAKVRLRAVVEPISRVPSTVYRSSATPSFSVRDDGRDVVIEELAS